MLTVKIDKKEYQPSFPTMGCVCLLTDFVSIYPSLQYDPSPESPRSDNQAVTFTVIPSGHSMQGQGNKLLCLKGIGFLNMHFVAENASVSNKLVGCS